MLKQVCKMFSKVNLCRLGGSAKSPGLPNRWVRVSLLPLTLPATFGPRAAPGKPLSQPRPSPGPSGLLPVPPVWPDRSPGFLPENPEKKWADSLELGSRTARNGSA